MIIISAGEETNPGDQELPYQLPVLVDDIFTVEAHNSFCSNGMVDLGYNSLKSETLSG